MSVSETPAATSPRKKWPRLRPQFSLRLLLLAFTAFALGFPIWYRWPYVEVEDSPPIRHSKTWRRTWGGGRVQHGEERHELGSAGVYWIHTYRNGVRHGPTLQMIGKYCDYAGEYKAGLREGVWEYGKRPTHEQPAFRVTYRQGLAEGIAELRGTNGRIDLLTFRSGELTAINGEPVADNLAKLAKASQIDNKRIADEVLRPTDLDFIETPLADIMDLLTDRHGIPMLLDPHVSDRMRPITFTASGLPFSTALVMLLNPHGLEATYRYGVVWITTAEDAQDWTDPTGVDQIRLPKDSEFAEAWNGSTTVTVSVTSLEMLLPEIMKFVGLQVDLSSLDQSQKDSVLTLNLNGLPFRDTLAIALYHANCRCELHGETLVILPQEAEP